MAQHPPPYLMENPDEILRLDIKTDPRSVREQAAWCGIRPGFRVLDAGCGPGTTTATLYEMIQPGGSILGLDYSPDRIRYARQKHSKAKGIQFYVHDLRQPLGEFGFFDFIWVRFVLEYNRAESADIAKNLTERLKPGGWLCLLDLDYNCLTHYPIPERLEQTISGIVRKLELSHNFDPFAGRKTYTYLHDMGFTDIQLELKAHHLIYGIANKIDQFNWLTKAKTILDKTHHDFSAFYPNNDAFIEDFRKLFSDPRRLTYTPLILCKGMKAK